MNDLETLIGAGTRLLDIPVDPAWHPTILANLDATLKLAGLVDSFPLPDESDPAPVFEA